MEETFVKCVLAFEKNGLNYHVRLVKAKQTVSRLALVRKKG